MKRKRILLDVHEVLLHLARPVLNCLYRLYNIRLHVEEIINYDMSPHISQNALHQIFLDSKMWDECYPIAGAESFLRQLMEIRDKHNIGLDIATQISPVGWKEGIEGTLSNLMTMELLYYDFDSGPSIIITPDKKRIIKPTDIVIDDCPDNLNHALSIGAFPVCIKRTWNRPESKPAWNGPRYNYDGSVIAIEKELNSNG